MFFGYFAMDKKYNFSQIVCLGCPQNALLSHGQFNYVDCGCSSYCRRDFGHDVGSIIVVWVEFTEVERCQAIFNRNIDANFGFYPYWILWHTSRTNL